MKIGVISDTHGLLDARVEGLFSGVDAIVHAGDIGRLEIIESLQTIAPVFAVEGNNDSFGLFPIQRLEKFNGRRVLIRHIFGEPHQVNASTKQLAQEAKAEIVLFGHSHRPYRGLLGKTVLFNPGSAGPKRFSLPRTVGILLIGKSRIQTRILTLE